jgi:hypothetical protein
VKFSHDLVIAADTTEPETTLKEEIATVTEPLSEKPSNATAIVSVEQTITEVKQ